MIDSIREQLSQQTQQANQPTSLFSIDPNAVYGLDSQQTTKFRKYTNLSSTHKDPQLSDITVFNSIKTISNE